MVNGNREVDDDVMVTELGLRGSKVYTGVETPPLMGVKRKDNLSLSSGMGRQ